MVGDRPAFLRGERVVLIPVEQENIPTLAKWLNDDAVTYYMFYGQRPFNLEQVTEEIRRHVLSSNDVVFIIEEQSSGKPVGFAGLHDLHPTARKAELRILIGEKAAWSQGYGTEATELLTFYGFDRLNLNRVWLGVTAENERAVRAYERAGYVVEGRLRQDIYRNSRYYDSIRMAILREEYYPSMFEQHCQRFSKQGSI
jgi:RimJ/RimL family protein N-acetyltransferase